MVTRAFMASRIGPARTRRKHPAQALGAGLRVGGAGN
jgi:hypothetical protein